MVFFIRGFSVAFHIPFVGPHLPTDCRNLKSAGDLPEVVRKKMAEKNTEGRVAGPFSSPPLLNLRISPLAVVP